MPPRKGKVSVRDPNALSSSRSAAGNVTTASPGTKMNRGRKAGASSSTGATAASATATATATAVASVPMNKPARGRGRPMKSPNGTRRTSGSSQTLPAASVGSPEAPSTLASSHGGPSSLATRGRGRPKSQAVSQPGNTTMPAVAAASIDVIAVASSNGSDPTVTNTDSPTPRGRGRPPKTQVAVKSSDDRSQPGAVVPSSNAKDTGAALEPSSNLTSPPSRGRGRPPKSLAAPKPMGGTIPPVPASSTGHAVENDGVSDPSSNKPTPTPRGRGRPPKSQAAPKPASGTTSEIPASSTNPVDVESAITEPSTDPITSVPRGRGRPSKSQAVSKSPGKATPAAAEFSAGFAAPSSNAPEGSSAGSTLSASRSRGRPPKSSSIAKPAGSPSNQDQPASSSGIVAAHPAASAPAILEMASSVGSNASTPQVVDLVRSPKGKLRSDEPPSNAAPSTKKAPTTPTRGRKRHAAEVIDLGQSGSSPEPRPVKSRKAAAETKAAAKTNVRSNVGASPASRSRTKQRRSRRSHALPVYEDLWKDVYLTGTEWDQLQLVYNINWEFDHLDEALNEGDLVEKKVLLFGATEPQLLKMDADDKKGQVVPIPVIIAVVTEASPPTQVGLKSVQKAEEEIVPMADLRMHWQPFRPSNVAHNRTFKPKVLVMQCNERRARLRNMGEAEVHRYDYVLPYFFNPEAEDDLDFNSEVNILVDLEGRQAPLMCEFDFEMDDLEDFVEEQLKENDLDAEVHGEPLKTAIRDGVRAAKLKIKELKEERKKQIDAISPEERDAIRNMKLIKFYPMNEWPDLSGAKSKYINRYYGSAHEVRDDFTEE